MFAADAASSLTTSELTVRAFLVAGAAIIVLVLFGRGKPARAPWWIPRARRADPVMVVQQVPTPVLKRARAPLWRKVRSIAAMPVLSLLIGVLLAVGISVGAIKLVTALTDMLKT